MHLAAHLLLEVRHVLLVRGIPQRQRHIPAVAVHLGIVLPQLLLDRGLVVVRQVTKEQERQHVVAEVVRVHRSAQLVRDGPESLAEFFLSVVDHGVDSWIFGAFAGRASCKT